MRKNVLPPAPCGSILALSFSNKLGDLGRVFESLRAFGFLMCTTEIIISAFPTLQDYSKDQIV